MKFPFLLFYLFIFTLSLTAQGQSTNRQELFSKVPRVKVYLLGTFHYARMDSTYDIHSPEHQNSIEELSQIIVRQEPEKVFLERQPEFEFQNKIDSLYQDYRKVGYTKQRNELFQLGFRVARNLGHDRVYLCDHPGRYSYLYRQTRQYALAHEQADILNANATGTVERLDDLINDDSLRRHSSLLEYVQWINSDAVMSSSHAFYVANFPLIGSENYYDYDDDDTLIGAELLADWYRRNIMIYTKIINQLTYRENAIFLLMGSDHIPVLSQLFASNPHFEVINSDSWLASH